MKVIIVAHAFIVGGIAVAWGGYGIYLKRFRYIVEAFVLLLFVAINTFIFWILKGD